jgi:predicted sugar kinase
MALAAAWALSAAALLVNQFYFHESGIGPGLSLGLVSLAVQAAVLFFVGLGSRTARALTVVFLILAILPLPMIGRLVAERSLWEAGYTAAGFALKALATLLLFTGDAQRWFAAR